MAWWNRILGGPGPSGGVDYYEEGLDLLSEGKYHEALTSFRLALKESPGDTVVLQQIAIAYTRIGMMEEAVKTYRHVLQKEPGSAGAHYGLAYLLLRTGDQDEARAHLRAFLDHVPNGADAGEHIAHARETLETLEGGGDLGGGDGASRGRHAGL